jgi:hypothetical protein
MEGSQNDEFPGTWNTGTITFPFSSKLQICGTRNTGTITFSFSSKLLSACLLKKIFIFIFIFKNLGTGRYSQTVQYIKNTESFLTVMATVGYLPERHKTAYQGHNKVFC